MEDGWMKVEAMEELENRYISVSQTLLNPNTAIPLNNNVKKQI